MNKYTLNYINKIRVLRLKNLSIRLELLNYNDAS